MSDPIDWKQRLSPLQYDILRLKGTEAPFTGAYWDTTTAGTYACAGCDTLLYRSNDKFDAGCGWPSFTQAAASDRLLIKEDLSGGRIRNELLCAACGGHLGHIFNDGPAPTGMRHCINSAALKFLPDDRADANGDK